MNIFVVKLYYRAGEPHNCFLRLRLFFQAAPAPDFFWTGGSGSWYFFFKRSGSYISSFTGFGSWLLVKFGKTFFPNNLQNVKLQDIKKSKTFFYHKSFLYYLKKSNKCTTFLVFLSSSSWNRSSGSFFLSGSDSCFFLERFWLRL